MSRLRNSTKRRVTRFRGSVLLAVGLLACLAWVVTGWFVVFWGNGVSLEIDVAYGVIRFLIQTDGPDWSYGFPNHGLSIARKPFHLEVLPSFRVYNNGVASQLPLWCIGLPMIALAGFRRWTANTTGVDPACRSCGYDLTGNVSGRCPECGTPAE